MLRKEWLNGLWAPDDGSTGDAGEGSTGETKQPATFEAFLEAQAPEVKALYEAHTKGLKSALDAERQQRSELARQLREAAGKAEAGSAAQKTLLEMQAKYEALERRQVFMDEAVKPETGCSDPRLAYLAAQEIGAISDKGKVDWSAAKLPATLPHCRLLAQLVTYGENISYGLRRSSSENGRSSCFQISGESSTVIKPL